MTPNGRGALLALLGFAIFAGHDAIIKFLGGIYSPFQIIFFTVLFGFPWLTIMMVSDKRAETMRPKHPWWVLIRSLCVLVSMLGGFYAFSVLPLAQTYSILFATPLVITVLSIPLLGERVGIHRWFAVWLGLVGVLVVIQPGSAPLSLGHIAAMFAVLASALGSVVVRKIGRDERNVVLVLLPMLTSFLVVGAILPFHYQPMPVSHLGILALLSLLSIAAINIMVIAYKIGEAAVIAPMQYSQMIWAIVFGMLFFAEQPDANTLIGATIIIISGVYVVWRESRSKISNNTPVLRTKSRPMHGAMPVRALDYKTQSPKPDQDD